jgi:hypothetical protein
MLEVVEQVVLIIIQVHQLQDRQEQEVQEVALTEDLLLEEPEVQLQQILVGEVAVEVTTILQLLEEVVALVVKESL